MERQTVIGFVLIFVILLLWMYLNAPAPQPQSGLQQDSVAKVQEKPKEAAAQTPISPEKSDTSKNTYSRFFPRQSAADEKFLIVETDLYTAAFTSKGGLLLKWELKKYKSADSSAVQLIDYEKGGDLSLIFQVEGGEIVNTRSLFFNLPTQSKYSVINLSGKQEDSIDFVLPTLNGGKIIKHFKFKNGQYDFLATVRFENCQSIIRDFKYRLIWENGLRYAEQNSVTESQSAMSYAYGGKNLTELDATDFEKPAHAQASGNFDWIATRNQYFAVAIIPQQTRTEGIILDGLRVHKENNGAQEIYNIAFEMPLEKRQFEQNTFKIYAGPLEYSLLKSYDIGLEKMINLGWSWIIRPISEYLMLPALSIIHMGFANWGIVIIIFSLLIKLLLHPLTRSQMKSMKKMQQLQPMLKEIQEKYKDDPQKMNSQVMQMYKDYGVNPLGGCLPLLLQLPILWALYSVFSGAIELRHASFMWWITDLSRPDSIATLPFTIPLFGIRELSGLALIMGATMIISQKMTVTDPRQKQMIYLMPIMFMLLFNNFPSGLNLYYLVFNILSIGQQFYVNKQHKDDPIRKVEQKKRPRGGIFGRLPSKSDLERLSKRK